MQRHWAITLGLLVLMRSSWSVAMAPVWVSCQCCSVLLFNNTEKYFEDPTGEHNTLCSRWSGSVFAAEHCLMLLKKIRNEHSRIII